jgi:hypothetical protein
MTSNLTNLYFSLNDPNYQVMWEAFLYVIITKSRITLWKPLKMWTNIQLLFRVLNSVLSLKRYNLRAMHMLHFVPNRR